MFGPNIQSLAHLHNSLTFFDKTKGYFLALCSPGFTYRVWTKLCCCFEASPFVYEYLPTLSDIRLEMTGFSCC